MEEVGIFMLEWMVPQPKDSGWVSRLVEISGCMGSDCAFANIYLLRNKYHIRISRYKDYVIRYYEGGFSRRGYTFPVGRGDIKKALSEIKKDAGQTGRAPEFCFLTEGQKNMLEQVFPNEYRFYADDGDRDYIYAAQDLANLSGRSYHKKKNHVSKFVRTYPEYEFYEIGVNNVDDAARVEDAWYYEHLQSEDDSVTAEFSAIKEALADFEELDLSGGIIYANGVPAAMTIASRINDKVWDIHFEKAVGEYALNGGFAAINQMFAKQLQGVCWINREEDVNIEGLRKAKESYHPKMMLKKYSAKPV